MVWYTLWFLVILKIPALYLAYMIWWAVKDPPEAGAGPAEEWGGGGGRLGPRPRPSRRPIPGRRPGPHGTPARRPAPVLARARARKPA